MARMTADERAALPESAFVFPKKRAYPLYRMVDGKAVPDAPRSRSAMRFATLLEDQGKLSKSKAGKVRGAARKMLKTIGGKSSKPRKSSAKTSNPCTTPAKTSNPCTTPKKNPAKFQRHKGRTWHPPRQWTVLPELGRVVDLEVRHPSGVVYKEKYSRGDHPLMLWDRQSKTLLWVYTPGVKVPPLRSGAPREGGHAEMYERWMDDGSEATQHRQGYKVPSKTDTFHRAGSAVEIGYDSDKFAEPRLTTYGHPFTSDVSVYVGQFGRSHAIALRGGKLRVTARGIEG